MAKGKNTADVVKGLERSVANAYALTIKTHAYHWNVQGPNFYGLHKMFQEQYEELFPAIDELAERMRALGSFAPGGLDAFKSLTSVGEPKGGGTSWQDMVKDLVDSRKAILEQEREVMEAAESVDDQTTADLMAERIGKHQEAIWMMESLLK
ncbi:MAG: Dps family protein [Alphaproteobacteria bacterium]